MTSLLSAFCCRFLATVVELALALVVHTPRLADLGHILEVAIGQLVDARCVVLAGNLSTGAAPGVVQSVFGLDVERVLI
jgi:hypothetical protein